MAFKTLDERLAQLEAIISDMKQENLEIPIVVEGLRDIESLQKLGFSGEILSINIGKTLLNFCEMYAKDHKKVIILMDWDPRGRRLRKSLNAKFQLAHVEVNDIYWLELRKLAFPEIKDIQSLASLMERLREKKRLLSI